MKVIAVKNIKQSKGRALPKAKNYRAYVFNPAISFSEEQGNFPTKEKYAHPFETDPLGIALLFFDPTDRNQLAWAKEQVGTWILTNGQLHEDENEEGRVVYVDHDGYLSKTLGVRCLPAKVSQEGKVLKIEEIPCGFQK